MTDMEQAAQTDHDRASIMTEMRERGAEKERVSARLRELEEELKVLDQKLHDTYPQRKRVCLKCGMHYSDTGPSCPNADCLSERWEYADARVRDKSTAHFNLPGTPVAADQELPGSSTDYTRSPS